MTIGGDRVWIKMMDQWKLERNALIYFKVRVAKGKGNDIHCCLQYNVHQSIRNHIVEKGVFRGGLKDRLLIG